MLGRGGGGGWGKNHKKNMQGWATEKKERKDNCAKEKWRKNSAEWIVLSRAYIKTILLKGTLAVLL